MITPTSLETRYRIALEVGQIGSWQWDAASGLIDLDERACGIIGVAPPARLAGHEIEQIVHPQDRANRRACWAQALDPKGTGEFMVEYRLIQPGTGLQRWVSTHAKVDFKDGAPNRAVGVVRDVTERRRAEAIFAGIVSIAADAIITIDDKHRITLFNDGAERTFGYARDEVIRQPLDILLPETLRHAHADHVRKFGASGTSARKMGERSEIHGRRKNGELFSAEASISHLEIGSESLFTVVLRDVSERKRVEELLAKSNLELEARVDERTRELNAEMQRREQTQAQLVRTQRMEAFGQLTGGVAHDFNNILTVITGNLELLDMRLVNEKDRTLLKRAYDAAEMGARLTARLLTFARRRQYETARLNLNDQIMGMVDLLGRTLGEPIVLDTRFDARIWPVYADPSEIENAILNLAINARDAMVRGGRLIIETANVTVEEGQIGMLNKLAAGDYVRFSVSDNGSGMTPDVLQHALEPFFTTKRPGRGTGLGLSTIYGLAQELGGTVTIDSEVDHGTTVSVYLPRSDGPQVTIRQNHPGEAVTASAGETVLLVEDNNEVRQVTSSRLAELGYHVIESESGPEAVKALQSGETIDIVFSDIVMAGGMSGFEVAQWVMTNRPGMKILLASGFAEDAARGQEKHLADLKIMRKPYSRADLARTLRQILDE